MKYEATGLTIDVRGGLLVVSEQGHDVLTVIRADKIQVVTDAVQFEAFGVQFESDTPGVRVTLDSGKAYDFLGAQLRAEGFEQIEAADELRERRQAIVDAFTRAMLEALNFKRG